MVSLTPDFLTTHVTSLRRPAADFDIPLHDESTADLPGRHRHFRNRSVCEAVFVAHGDIQQQRNIGSLGEHRRAPGLQPR